MLANKGITERVGKPSDPEIRPLSGELGKRYLYQQLTNFKKNKSVVLVRTSRLRVIQTAIKIFKKNHGKTQKNNDFINDFMGFPIESASVHCEIFDILFRGWRRFNSYIPESGGGDLNSNLYLLIR